MRQSSLYLPSDFKSVPILAVYLVATVLFHASVWARSEPNGGASFEGSRLLYESPVSEVGARFGYTALFPR